MVLTKVDQHLCLLPELLGTVSAEAVVGPLASVYEDVIPEAGRVAESGCASGPRTRTPLVARMRHFVRPTTRRRAKTVDIGI